MRRVPGHRERRSRPGGERPAGGLCEAEEKARATPHSENTLFKQAAAPGPDGCSARRRGTTVRPTATAPTAATAAGGRRPGQPAVCQPGLGPGTSLSAIGPRQETVVETPRGSGGGWWRVAALGPMPAYQNAAHVRFRLALPARPGRCRQVPPTSPPRPIRPTVTRWYCSGPLRPAATVGGWAFRRDQRRRSPVGGGRQPSSTANCGSGSRNRLRQPGPCTRRPAALPTTVTQRQQRRPQHQTPAPSSRRHRL